MIAVVLEYSVELPVHALRGVEIGAEPSNGFPPVAHLIYQVLHGGVARDGRLCGGRSTVRVHDR